MTSAPGDGLSEIGQISVTARDIDRATAFYRDTLRIKYLFSAPPQLAFFDCSGVRLMLGVPEKPEFDHPSSILYFKVPDIQAAHASLAERGVRFGSPPHLVAKLPSHDLWLADFRDSEGNQLALMSEVAR
jgi:predicted enzyme related to lactoylglutathione lyase